MAPRNDHDTTPFFSVLPPCHPTRATRPERQIAHVSQNLRMSRDQTLTIHSSHQSTRCASRCPPSHVGRPRTVRIPIRPRAWTEAECFCLQHPRPSREQPRTTRAGASALFTSMQARGEPGRNLKLREGLLRELAQRMLVPDSRDLLRSSRPSSSSSSESSASRGRLRSSQAHAAVALAACSQPNTLSGRSSDGMHGGRLGSHRSSPFAPPWPRNPGRNGSPDE